MTKLPVEKKFLDFSDYARPLAVFTVNLLMPTRVGAYTLTFLFLFTGMIASYLIYIDQYPFLSALLIILKSMLDAADGEIARRRNEPSIVGRYMDSVFDFIINLSIFLAIALRFEISLWLMGLALFLFQMQGSVFNYYYLVKRYQVKGDRTSRIFESEEPEPMKRDNPMLLKFFHKLYLIIYVWQDYLIYSLDKKAVDTSEIPGWFLSIVSFLGLGFQLLIIAFLLVTGFLNITFYFFIIPYTILTIIIKE